MHMPELNIWYSPVKKFDDYYAIDPSLTPSHQIRRRGWLKNILPVESLFLVGSIPWLLESVDKSGVAGKGPVTNLKVEHKPTVDLQPCR